MLQLKGNEHCTFRLVEGYLQLHLVILADPWKDPQHESIGAAGAKWQHACCPSSQPGTVVDMHKDRNPQRKAKKYMQRTKQRRNRLMGHHSKHFAVDSFKICKHTTAHALSHCKVHVTGLCVQCINLRWLHISAALPAMRHTVPFLLLCVAVLSHNVLSQQPIGSKKVVKTPPPASPTQATPSPTPPPPQKQQVVAEAWDGADMPSYRGYDYRGEEDSVITSRHAAHPPHVSDYDQQQQHAADEQTEQQRYRQREAQQAAEGERKKQADIALARYISQQQQQAKYEDLELKSARQPIQDQHDSYQQHTPDCKEKEDHCPTPQQADDVKQGGAHFWKLVQAYCAERLWQKGICGCDHGPAAWQLLLLGSPNIPQECLALRIIRLPQAN